MTKQKSSLSIFTLIASVAVCYAAYYLLLTDTLLHISISSIFHFTHHLAAKGHLLILGLVPIYISFMIFGAALLGLYLGEKLDKLLNNCSARHHKFLREKHLF